MIPVYVCTSNTMISLSLSLSHTQHTHTHIRMHALTTVRPFNFEFPNITIPEPNGTANVCITMTGATDVPITVTARTGPKGGASNPATGINRAFY